MQKYTLLNSIFILSLFIALVISFYLFIMVIVFKDKEHISIFSTWQFPMLLALFIDVVFLPYL